jgi:hypothetical protein
VTRAWVFAALLCSCTSITVPMSNEPEPEPEKEPIEGYPAEERIVGLPGDIDRDLDTAFPKSDAIFDIRVREKYFKWKEDVYEKAGVKLAWSYQAVFQHATDVRNQRLLTGEDTVQGVSGGWLLIEAKWDAINRGEDWQGSLAVALDWRHTFGNSIDPAGFQFDTGSVWATEFTLISWDPWLPIVFWEQWAHKDRFVTRIGSQTATGIFDFFRFKDARSSFTNSEFWFPAAAMPIPGPGFGVSFEFWPVEDSTLYVVGTVNDMNFTIEENFRWGSFFDEADYFYGLEIGYNWVRGQGDFDHFHVLFFYADTRKELAPVFPSRAGGGFKLRGSKQWGPWVAFGSYTYNTAEGGAFGNTWLEHAATAGVAYVKPLGIRGELALGANWGRPIQEFGSGLPLFNDLRDQFGVETYWKMLLLPDLWITPTISGIWNPSLNPDTDFLALFTFKFRLFF